MRTRALLIAAAISASVFTSLPAQAADLTGPAEEQETPSLSAAAVTGTERVAGADRYQTAIKISQKNYAPGVGVVYLSTGSNYPDALSAAPAAAKLGGPLLLTLPDRLPEEVRQEIERLQPAQIVVVGGVNAVSRTVYNAVATLAPTRRDAGSDRYETSRILTVNAFADTGAQIAYVATGNNFPDALSASAAAGSTQSPVILVNGQSNSVDAATSGLLSTLGSSEIRIAGGTAVVSSAIESGLKKAATVRRLAGADRYSTSVAINTAAFSSAPTTYLAVGSSFADALAGAALAGRDSAPLYVVPNNCVPDGALSAMGAAGSVRTVLLGGKAALGAGVENQTPCSSIPAPTPPAPPAPPAPPVVSGPTVTAGAYCKKTDAGLIGYTKTGMKMVCSTSATDSRYRWRAA